MANPAIQTFGKYQILERIATGGMAEIYKARLEGIGGFQRTFAIKRILPNLSQNSEYIAMLVDEAKVAGLLSHANIVQILDLGQVDGIWYIAMEYVHGRDLGAVLRRAKKKGLCLPVPHTVFVAIELLKGLEYAHQRQVMRGGRPVALNIIHRDVSPPNILLSFQGEVKLTDFGIARASLKAMETVSGIVKGRFDYMSPEQAAGAKDLDQRSDLFSVGVVLYEMLTGHHPFRTDNEIGTIERVRTGKYIPVSQRNPEVPFTLETIVDRALQVSREDRYPSATAFKEALDKFFHDAGFIFTHATLASYVKGLFPEANAKPGAAKTTSPGITTTAKNKLPRSAGNTEPVTGGVSGGDPAEGPTRRLDRNKLKEIRNSRSGTPAPAPAARSATPTPPTAGARGLDTDSITASGNGKGSPLADFLQQDDQETLIRKAPVGWEDELASAAQSRPQGFEGDGDEQETVIRKPPPELVDEQPHELSSTGTGPVTGTGGTGTSGTGSGRRTTGTGSRKRKDKAARSGVGWLGWVVAAVALFIGLFGGSIASIGLMLAANFRYLPTDSPMHQQPRIEVSAPIGTQILLDGDAVGKQITVEPDKVHELVVTLQGHDPWTTDIKLGMGETRVIVVSPVEVKAPQQKPKPR